MTFRERNRGCKDTHSRTEISAAFCLFLFLLLALTATAPAASAQIIGPQDPNDPQVDSPWQAGTCKADPSPPAQCSVGTPLLFFEQAAGHPPKGFTQFIVNHTTEEPAPGVVLEEPEGDVKTVRVDLPTGLTVNPQATPQCQQSVFETTPLACPAGSEVGTSFAWAALLGV